MSLVARTISLAREHSRSLVANSLFMVANTVSGSFFGFIFWVVAARTMTTDQVGLGAALISGVTFLANIADLGLGNALIRFNAAMGRQQSRFINSLLCVDGIAIVIAAVVFGLGTPIWSADLGELTQSGWYFVLFVATALAFAVAQVADDMFVAAQVTHFLFIRNASAAMLRVLIAVVLGSVFGGRGLLLAVGIAAGLTLLVSLLLLAPRAVPGYCVQPIVDWTLLRGKVNYTLGNHVAKLLNSAPSLVLPLVIVSVLGTEANAYFYTSWMIANLLYIFPVSISTSAFARVSNYTDMNDRAFWQTMRRTLLILVPITTALALFAPLLLQVFGKDYVTSGQSLELYLLLSVFPYTVVSFSATYYRIHLNPQGAIGYSAAVAALSLVLIVMFGAAFGLEGIGMGWLAGQSVGMLIAFWVVPMHWADLWLPRTARNLRS